MSLQDYKDTVGAVAGIFTLLTLLAPALLCLDFIKRGSTQNVDAMPFIGGLVLGVLFIQNSIIIDDTTMLYVNIFAVILSTCYLLLYYLYTKEKVKFYIKLSKAVVFIAVLISYAQRESKDVIQFRFGLITTLILLAFIGSPLLSVNEIIKTKNTEALPIPLILTGSLVSFSWFLYGVIIDDVFVKIQNLIAFGLNAFQLGLYLYCKVSTCGKKSTSPSKKTN